MYAQSVINRRLARAAERLGFDPELHSIADCRSAVDILDRLVDTAGGLTRLLRPDEIKWVRNERAVCQCDFRYWVTHYAYIRDWTDRPVLFKPNIAQEIKLDIWAMLEGAGHAVSEMDLKARQLGVTTLTELAVAHRVQFYPYVNAVVGSADPEKSLGIELRELILGGVFRTGNLPEPHLIERHLPAVPEMLEKIFIGPDILLGPFGVSVGETGWLPFPGNGTRVDPSFSRIEVTADEPRQENRIEPRTPMLPVLLRILPSSMPPRMSSPSIRL